MKNLMKKNESDMIWTPQIKFSLLKKDSLEKLEKQIVIEKNGRPSKSNEHSISPNEAYEGYENIIEIKTLLQGVFICPYNSITEYPFDEEKCAFKMKCDGEGCNRINFIPGHLKIIPKSFG